MVTVKSGRIGSARGDRRKGEARSKSGQHDDSLSPVAINFDPAVVASDLHTGPQFARFASPRRRVGDGQGARGRKAASGRQAERPCQPSTVNRTTQHAGKRVVEFTFGTGSNKDVVFQLCLATKSSSTWREGFDTLIFRLEVGCRFSYPLSDLLCTLLNQAFAAEDELLGVEVDVADLGAGEGLRKLPLCRHFFFLHSHAVLHARRARIWSRCSLRAGPRT